MSVFRDLTCHTINSGDQVDQRAALFYAIYSGCCDDEEGPEDLLRCQLISHQIDRYVVDFEQYHMTHRVLTSAWPSPPLPHLIALLTPLPAKTVIVDLGCGDAGLARALVPQGKVVLSYDLVGDSGIPASTGGGGWVVETDFLEGVPLPGRTGGSSTKMIIDTKDVRKSKMNRGVEEEAASEVVDVVVCCLSLMGTNWVGGIYEACRILKQR